MNLPDLLVAILVPGALAWLSLHFASKLLARDPPMGRAILGVLLRIIGGLIVLLGLANLALTIAFAGPHH
jgi:hypothetical protein